MHEFKERYERKTGRSKKIVVRGPIKIPKNSWGDAGKLPSQIMNRCFPFLICFCFFLRKWNAALQLINWNYCKAMKVRRVEFYSKVDSSAISTSFKEDLARTSLCNHEEAGTRLILCAADALSVKVWKHVWWVKGGGGQRSFHHDCWLDVRFEISGAEMTALSWSQYAEVFFGFWRCGVFKMEVRVLNWLLFRENSLYLESGLGNVEWLFVKFWN